jgi:predicted metal-binding membrane protein
MFTSTHLHDARRDRAILAASLAALAGIAWIALAAWSASPYARYLHHDGAGASLQAGEAGLFVLGWVVMIVAMMLPSSIPLVLVFAAVVGRRPRPRLLVGLLLAGYLVAWAAFGAAAWLSIAGFRRRRRLAVAREPSR